MANVAKYCDWRETVRWVIRSLYFTPFILVSVAIELIGRLIFFRRYACISWKGVRSPTVTLERRSDGKRVVLVGVYHVADEEFYDGLQRTIDERERNGAAVLFEGIKSKEIDYEALPRGSVRQLSYRLCNIGRQHERMAKEFGLVTQYERLKRRDSWIWSDIHGMDIIRMAIEKNVVREMGDEIGIPPPEPHPDDDAPPLYTYDFDDVLLCGIGMRMIPLLRVYGVFKKAFNKKHHTVMEIIVDRRNRVAVDGILNALTAFGEAVSVWGSGHLPGMVKMLKAEGFRVKRIDWPVAIGFRENGLLALAERTWHSA